LARVKVKGEREKDENMGSRRSKREKFNI